ncbi:hypothetical protein Q1M64_11500 (plasmid) [Sinorhizobium meliloti]|nr:hypothetical protein Q1M64_11500 [Sinorhizobium meliloti]
MPAARSRSFKAAVSQRSGKPPGYGCRRQKRSRHLVLFHRRDCLRRAKEGSHRRLFTGRARILAETHRAYEAGRRVADDRDPAVEPPRKHIGRARLQQEPGGDERQAEGREREDDAGARRIMQLKQSDPDEADDRGEKIGGNGCANRRRHAGGKGDMRKEEDDQEPRTVDEADA